MIKENSLPSETETDAQPPDVELPTLEYGYRTEPLEWSELQRILTVEQNPAKLTRNVDQQRTYMIYSRQIKSEWRSMIDFILCTKFGLEKRKDETESEADALWYSHPSLNELDGIHIRIVKNDFPYYFAENIEHWILWKIGEPCSEADIVASKQSLQDDLGDVTDFLHWINPPHLKSLPEVDHVHILVRRREKS